MKRYSIALLSAVVALSMVLVAVPALGSGHMAEWDYPTGLALTPGGEVQVGQVTLSEPAGWECTAHVEIDNGESVHLGNNLNVYLNGGLLMTLLDIEGTPFKTADVSAGFVATGADVLVAKIESTGATITSSAGSLTATCTPPSGGEGCTPGYWKQPHHFDSWAATGHAPGHSFDAMFGVDSSFDTLLDGAKAKGGKEKALARHAVAALLNASNPEVSYEYVAAEVIALVQDAYAGGHFEGVKNMLVYQNEMGCPLN